MVELYWQGDAEARAKGPRKKGKNKMLGGNGGVATGLEKGKRKRVFIGKRKGKG